MGKNKRKGQSQVQEANPDPREIIFQKEFREDLRYWARNDRQVLDRIFDLIEETIRSPFEDIGKPEPLKHDLEGCWSRRITQEHRLVYMVRRERIDFLQGRYHY